MRQLRNVVERVLILGDGNGDITARELPAVDDAPGEEGRVVLSGALPRCPCAKRANCSNGNTS